MLTPQFATQKLSQAIGLNQELYIKREDLHPLGSHKGRSIPPMIDKYIRDGKRDFVISSSGNAALAAIGYIQEYNKANNEEPLTLTIFTGEKINLEKYTTIAQKITGDKNFSLHKLNNPRQSAFLVDQAGDAKLLRQSTDDSALKGYEELARELGTIRELAAVFIPSSSGTTAQGIFEAFKNLKINPQIHIVQTDYCHALCQNDDLLDMIESKKPSLADAIVDRVGHRKEKIIQALEASGGKSWVVNDEDIAMAQKFIKKNTGIDASPNSALSVAGLYLAIASGTKFNGPVVCIFTGK